MAPSMPICHSEVRTLESQKGGKPFLLVLALQALVKTPFYSFLNHDTLLGIGKLL